MSTFIYVANCVVSGEIYTNGKNFTLPPPVTALTNITSVSQDSFTTKAGEETTNREEAKNQGQVQNTIVVTDQREVT